jgi:hypothetical protein
VLVSFRHPERSEGSQTTVGRILRSFAVVAAQDDGRAVVVALFLLFFAFPLFAQQLTLNDSAPLYTDAIPFTITGTAPPNARVRVDVEGGASGETTADATGRWSLLWTAPLKTGTYDVRVTANGASVTQLLRVQLPSLLQRQNPFGEAPVRYGNVEVLLPETAMEMTDRWRIVPPPYELDESPRHRRLDPYNKNRLKGDYPISGNDTFFVFTGISDSLAESRTLPTPSGVAAAEPGSVGFFGRDDQNVFNQNVELSFDLYQGLTTFQPVRQRVKATLIANYNRLSVAEDAIVKPDVREGTVRNDGHLALQELFYERKLRDLSPNYDFVSVRVGSQPFNSDFRGFIFTDTNLGVRLFGNWASNRYQYNLAVFDRLEKDTNSGLNTLNELRGQKVFIANAYAQDFLVHGYTQEFSIHYLRDDASLKYDRNGVLVRPAPVGAFTPHAIRATYLGEAGLGHIGRLNVDHAVYYVFGHDSINPIAGPDPLLRGGDGVKIRAGMAALEVSLDRDWVRPRLGFFYATGDSDPRDRTARGFDAIYEAPNFAGGGFSFFNRLGIKLAGSGVSLVERGSLLADLRSSKDEGQPNYVNPGVQIATAGVDIDVTPRLKTIVTANYIRLGTTAPIEELLFQGDLHRSLGTDVSVGLRWRPFLNQNVIVVGGAAGFKPAAGFKDINESGKTLYHVFTDLILTF